MHLSPLTPAEMELIESTRRAYRKMWAKLRNVPSCTFDGGREDIDALDFIDYELGGKHPDGHVGAAVIWGGVLVSTGILQWAIGDGQHFVLTTRPDDWPPILIFPYARVTEMKHTRAPQFGQFSWLLEEVVVRICMLGIRPEDDRTLRSFLRLESDGFIKTMLRNWIDEHDPDPRDGTTR